MTTKQDVRRNYGSGIITEPEPTTNDVHTLLYGVCLMLHTNGAVHGNIIYVSSSFADARSLADLYEAAPMHNSMTEYVVIQFRTRTRTAPAPIRLDALIDTDDEPSYTQSFPSDLDD